MLSALDGTGHLTAARVNTACFKRRHRAWLNGAASASGYAGHSRQLHQRHLERVGDDESSRLFFSSVVLTN